jgi:hypothetical protein
MAQKKGLPLTTLRATPGVEAGVEAGVEVGVEAGAEAGAALACSVRLRRCLEAASFAQQVAAKCEALRAETVDRTTADPAASSAGLTVGVAVAASGVSGGGGGVGGGGGGGGGGGATGTGTLAAKFSDALESVWEALSPGSPEGGQGKWLGGGDVSAAWGEVTGQKDRWRGGDIASSHTSRCVARLAVTLDGHAFGANGLFLCLPLGVCQVGFQGVDPCTDFRGGGFLSLLQLRACVVGPRRAESKRALALCEDPGCYLPFATTAINFSAW